MEQQDLMGQVAVVTGGGKGLGWAIAERLAKDGATIGREALAVPTDVSMWSDVENMVEATMDKFKRIDILINNAGILGPYHPVMEYPEDIWDKVIAVHLKGTFLCCKGVLPIMKDKKSGKVVNMGSVAGKEGNANMSPMPRPKQGSSALPRPWEKRWPHSTCGSTAFLRP
jgi:NAD(P)-dependent dehydrogenase (short-subunit alcohol dehydrogenase family)